MTTIYKSFGLTSIALAAASSSAVKVQWTLQMHVFHQHKISPPSTFFFFVPGYWRRTSYYNIYTSTVDFTMEECTEYVDPYCCASISTDDTTAATKTSNQNQPNTTKTTNGRRQKMLCRWHNSSKSKSVLPGNNSFWVSILLFKIDWFCCYTFTPRLQSMFSQWKKHRIRCPFYQIRN